MELSQHEPRVKNYYDNFDNKHCLQACYQMVVDHFLEEKLSVEAAERETGWELGMATWPYAAMLSFAERGLDVYYAEAMDQELLAEQPEQAIKQYLGEEVWEYNVRKSNMPRVQSEIKACLESEAVQLEQKVPTLEDIKHFCEAGALVVCLVNARKLDDKKGYSGHYIIVDRVEGDAVVIHDSGMPPTWNWEVSREFFEKAWLDPNENAANIMAISKKEEG